MPLFGQSNAYQQLLSQGNSNGSMDYARLSDDNIQKAQLYFSTRSLDGLTPKEEKAFWIDAYNFNVIQQIASHYPTGSVKKISGFFKNKLLVAGQKISLNEIERQLLKDKDGRLHFALVCGAKSCPPLCTNTFEGDDLDQKLDAITKHSMAQAQIQYRENGDLWISQLFNWYSDDIGDPIQFINTYAEEKVSPEAAIKYQPYDWSLNDVQANGRVTTSNSTSSGDGRYYASNLYAAGEDEWFFFNNNYSQYDSDTDIRSNFFSSFLQYTRGVNSSLNWAVELKFRSVTEGKSADINTFSSLAFANKGYEQTTNGRKLSRIGLSAITPKIRYQPNKSIAGLTIQHGLSIPLIFSEAEGGANTGYLDWSTPSLYNDLFYDTNLSAKTSLFIQLGLYLENVGSLVVPSRDGYLQFSSPLTLIYSYFPTKKSTFYGMINAAPKWGYQFSNGGEDFDAFPDHFNQYGLGYKYFLTDNLQFELLYTKFYGVKADRSAATYNLGFRYFGR